MAEQLELFDIITKETPSTIYTSYKYKIPGRTESPSVTGEMAESWIREFCEWNNLPLPKRFGKKTSRGKIGMYYGMLRTYNINEKKDILPQKNY